MRVLFVEDHATFARTAVAELMSEHDVVIAPSIAAALAELSAGGYDALLVDFDLPDGKGDAGANVVCAEGAFAKIGAVVEGLAPSPTSSR